MNEICTKLEAQDRADGLDRIVVGAAITDGDKVLLLRRPPGEFMAGLWELPSGKVERGEQLLDALGREITEETGLTATRITGYLGAFDYTSGSGRKTRQHTFRAKVDPTQTVTLTEHDAYQWAPLDSELPVSAEVSTQLLTSM